MTQIMTIETLKQAYREGTLTPQGYLEQCRQQALADSHNAWIAVAGNAQLTGWLAYLDGKSVDELPLYGVPFAVKDNIDLAGLPTTAACPDFAYQPLQSAHVVTLLMQAGAIPLGKTNLDQFATGLVGVRSPEPWGPCRNSFDPDYVSGGSSSGSAVTVATGQVVFSLGTDTAGSGRVPAAFNNILGLKASKGLLSARGVVPACRSLDCVTLFATTCDDLNLLLEIAGQYDEQDDYARPNLPENGSGAYRLGQVQGCRIGVPRAGQLAFFGDEAYQQAFADTLEQLKALGHQLIEVDFQPFLDAARLLYEGPWVAERLAAIESFYLADPGRCLPVIRTIIGGAEGRSAVEAYQAAYRLAAYKRVCDRILGEVDLVVTPTAGSHYTIAQVQAEPVALNSNLGYYTNFMNLLDYAAVALPAGFTRAGRPFGITLFGPAFADRYLLSVAAGAQQAWQLPLGATDTPLPASAPITAPAPALVELMVCGAHLSGLPLNHQLTERGGRLLATTSTASAYRLYALAGGPPLRPGLVRDREAGQAIEVELWQLPLREFGSFVAGIPAPLGIGKVELEDGRWVCGFICEPCGVNGATEITLLGGWRAYLVEQQG